MELQTSISVPGVKLRYFAYNCMEIKLPDGKTLVIDPCLNKTGAYSCGYDVNDLEGCDYVLINHSHIDHVDSLGKVYDRFHPMILAHAHTAQNLATFYDIPYIKMVPFTSGAEFLFDSFQVQIYGLPAGWMKQRRLYGILDWTILWKTASPMQEPCITATS